MTDQARTGVQVSEASCRCPLRAIVVTFEDFDTGSDRWRIDEAVQEVFRVTGVLPRFTEFAGSEGETVGCAISSRRLTDEEVAWMRANWSTHARSTSFGDEFLIPHGIDSVPSPAPSKGRA